MLLSVIQDVGLQKHANRLRLYLMSQCVHVYNLLVCILPLCVYTMQVMKHLFCLSYRIPFMLQNSIFIDVSTHSHIPYHCEAQSTWPLHTRSLGICFFLYNNLSSFFKTTQIASTVYPDTICTVCFTGMRSLLVIYCQVCIKIKKI